MRGIKIDSRKLIKFGTNSYVVSLPKGWLKRNLLKKGDSVYIHEKENELSISAADRDREKEARSIVIETKDKSLDLVATEIVTAYLTNHDIIEIRGEVIKQEAPKIRNVLRNLTGLEIIEQTSSKLIAKDLINIKEVEIETLIRRVDVIIRSMLEDTIKTLEEDYYESVYQRDMDINRLVFLAYRVLRLALIEPSVARSLKFSPLDIETRYFIMMHLERIGDQTKRIARNMNKLGLDNKSKKKLRDILGMMEKEYLGVMKAYYTQDRQLAMEIENRNSERMGLCNSFLKEHHKFAVINTIEHLKAMSSSIKHIARKILLSA